MINGLGIDIVQHNRINLKIAKKVLTASEFLIFSKTNNQVEYLASRFAAKEAIIKATNKKYSLCEIEILNDENGMPYTNILGILLSLSHEKEYSVACAIFQKT